MFLRIIVPTVLVLAVMASFYAWYRRKLSDLDPSDEVRSLPGERLTAERLRVLSSPPWRVVYEIGPKHFGDVDHVVIGPGGPIAIETSMVDRPVLDPAADRSDAHVVAAAAIARGGVDDVTRSVGVPCSLLARVYWGTPQPDRPAAVQLAPGLVAVEGQRLNDWLVSMPPGQLTPAQVDQVWQAIITGIGRPDPLT